jgi:hypothetical protein
MPAILFGAIAVNKYTKVYKTRHNLYDTLAL